MEELSSDVLPTGLSVYTGLLDELLDTGLLEELEELLMGLSSGTDCAGSELDSSGVDCSGIEEELLELLLDTGGWSVVEELLLTEDEELSTVEIDELFSEELPDELLSSGSLFPTQAAQVAEISADNITIDKNFFINYPPFSFYHYSTPRGFCQCLSISKIFQTASFIDLTNL